MSQRLTGFVKEYQEIPESDGFRFYCDRCRHHVDAAPAATLKKKILGAATRALGTTGQEARDLHREVTRAGGAREKELHAAADRIRDRFAECGGCGQWVCRINCWNGRADRCEDCAPNQEEVAAVARMKALDREAARRQEAEDRLYERAGVERQLQARNALEGRDCPQCGAEKRKGRFCNACGADLEAATPTCSGCGAENEPDARFCSGCGSALG